MEADLESNHQSWKRAVDFCSEWIELIHILLRFDELQPAFHWIERKFKNSSKNITYRPSWKHLFADLQQAIPLLTDDCKMVYKSRMFLLSPRTQKNMLIVIKHHKRNIDVTSFDKFCCFVVNNLDNLDECAKRIGLDYLFLNSKHQTDTGDSFNSDNSRKLTLSKNSSQFQESFKRKIKLVNGNTGRDINSEVDGKHIQREEFLQTETEQQCLPSSTLAGNSPVLLSQDFQLETKMGVSIDNCQNNFNSPPVEECNTGNNPEKKQKLDEEFDSLECCVDTKSPDQKKDSLRKLKLSMKATGNLSRVMQFKEMLEQASDFEASCKVLKDIVQLASVKNITSLCDLLGLKSSNELSMVFFLNCCSSEKANLSPTLLKELLVGSILPFLINVKISVPRNVFQSLTDLLKKSKESFISAVLLPLMLKTSNCYQEQFVFKFISLDYFNHEDCVEIFDKYVSHLSQGKEAITENGLTYLHCLLEKRLQVPIDCIPKIVKIFQSEVLYSSSKLVKLIILLAKHYSRNIMNFKDELIAIADKNSSFLKKTAIRSLQKIE